MSYNGSEKKIFYNNTSCHSQSSLLGVLQGTVMTPDDASIIKGQPKLRRRFLDIQLAQSDPLYVHHLTRYQRAMRFRNILLRKRDANGIEVWEDELARGGSYIVSKRYQALADLQGESSAILSAISGNAETIQLIYRSQCPKEENDKKGYYTNLFRKMRPREMQLGNTIIGPHRDDMQIFIGSKEARFFSSEGQQRSCVAALRLSEWELLRRYADEVPLMLLDDLGISLDGARRTRLFEYVGNLHQVFITTTEEAGSFGGGKGAFIIAL
jgi:DNA replication and repair protein RecF